MGVRTLVFLTVVPIRITHPNMGDMHRKPLWKFANVASCGFIPPLFAIPLHMYECTSVAADYGRGGSILVKALFADSSLGRRHVQPLDLQFQMKLLPAAEQG